MQNVQNAHLCMNQQKNISKRKKVFQYSLENLGPCGSGSCEAHLEVLSFYLINLVTSVGAVGRPRPFSRGGTLKLAIISWDGLFLGFPSRHFYEKYYILANEIHGAEGVSINSTQT